MINIMKKKISGRNKSSKKNQRFLTKSLFKTALECPAKLYYKTHKEYFNKSDSDSFLQSLAEGGYQVGELAKIYHRGGTDIVSLDKKKSIKQTNSLLKEKDVIIYEPAFQYKNFFIRVDILVKEGKHIEIIEVKSKSFSGSTQDDFLNKKGTAIASEWVPYLYDLAFQKFVVSNVLPDFEKDYYLMLADKNSKASVDGLNMMFPIITMPDGRKRVEIEDGLSPEKTGTELLIKVKVNDLLDKIIAGELVEELPMPFEEYVQHLADNLLNDNKIKPNLSVSCASCEFKTDKKTLSDYKSGFDECWRHVYEESGNSEKDETVLKIWNFRKKQELLDKNVFFMKDVNFYDFFEENNNVKGVKKGLSTKQRQWLQVAKSVNFDSSPYFNLKGIKDCLENVIYPLHFIDFETTMAAIPFYKGMHPYEGIAFQFSHHIMYEDGSVEHAGEYLNTKPGMFPNYEFVRELKKQLSQDEGTVFCYSQHENTILNIIFKQLFYAGAENIPDREELLDWIKTITKSGTGAPQKWVGERLMFDLLDMVKKYYYDPRTKGSNSIKYVLPAVLNSSKFLQEKYSKPIYGTSEFKSLNFENHTWISFDKDEVINPYKTLPEFKLESSGIDKIAEGGTAMSAYGVLQFEHISDNDRKTIEQALLKYCELDTFSMVAIWEYFKDIIYKK